MLTLCVMSPLISHASITREEAAMEEEGLENKLSPLPPIIGSSVDGRQSSFFLLVLAPPFPFFIFHFSYVW